MATLFSASQRKKAQAISQLVYCNPFTPARIEGERKALGKAFVPSQPVWSLSSVQDAVTSNVTALSKLVESMVHQARQRLLAGVKATPEELGLYQDLSLYHLYDTFRDPLTQASYAMFTGQQAVSLQKAWPRFREMFERELCLPGLNATGAGAAAEAAHVLACFFQIRRAFTNIFQYLVGGSMPMARLRAAVWESIFTHDLRRYYRGFHRHMGDFTTLITGESGTGKELVARAIGRSRYLPFDVKSGRFVEEKAAAFQAVNLAALSPALIESELFGHRRGAFTGAIEDRKGWLETCPPRGTVFLDEIGELDTALQVKLLRVLQTRTFERIGETAPRQFEGKVIAATNRDLAAQMQENQFRRDLYYRICSDVIHTPSLKQQLEDRPEDLSNMVYFIACRLTDDAEDASRFTQDITRWIQKNLGDAYDWPGNFRELEQCVRNVVIRGSYQPLRPREAVEAKATRGRLVNASDRESHSATTSKIGMSLENLFHQMAAGQLSADEVLTQYVHHMHELTGSYDGAARKLGLDRRTVKSRVDSLNQS